MGEQDVSGAEVELLQMRALLRDSNLKRRNLGDEVQHLRARIRVLEERRPLAFIIDTLAGLRDAVRDEYYRAKGRARHELLVFRAVRSIDPTLSRRVQKRLFDDVLQSWSDVN